MKISLFGKQIKFVNTTISDIDQIIDFETINGKFVNHYTREKHIELLSDKDCGHIAIRRIDNDQLVGHMIIFGLNSFDKVLEFRRVTINEKGHGFGKEAVKLLKELCFTELKYHRLWLDVFDDNERAIHIYESEGFTLEGVLRDNYKTETGYRSQRIYSILEHEFDH